MLLLKSPITNMFIVLALADSIYPLTFTCICFISSALPMGSVVHGTILDNFGHFFKLKLLEILLR